MGVDEIGFGGQPTVAQRFPQPRGLHRQGQALLRHRTLGLQASQLEIGPRHLRLHREQGAGAFGSGGLKGGDRAFVPPRLAAPEIQFPGSGRPQAVEVEADGVDVAP